MKRVATHTTTANQPNPLYYAIKTLWLDPEQTKYARLTCWRGNGRHQVMLQSLNKIVEVSEKKNQCGENFYMLFFQITETSFTIQGEKYCINQNSAPHLSFYQNFHKKEVPLSAMHMTIPVMLGNANESQAVVHLYFDSCGKHQKIFLVIGETTSVVTSEDDISELLKIYHEHAAPFMNELLLTICKEIRTLQQQKDRLIVVLERLSKNTKTLDKNISEYAKKRKSLVELIRSQLKIEYRKVFLETTEKELKLATELWKKSIQKLGELSRIEKLEQMISLEMLKDATVTDESSSPTESETIENDDDEEKPDSFAESVSEIVTKIEKSESITQSQKIIAINKELLLLLEPIKKSTETSFENLVMAHQIILNNTSFLINQLLYAVLKSDLKELQTILHYINANLVPFEILYLCILVKGFIIGSNLSSAVQEIKNPSTRERSADEVYEEPQKTEIILQITQTVQDHFEVTEQQAHAILNSFLGQQSHSLIAAAISPLVIQTARHYDKTLIDLLINYLVNFMPRLRPIMINAAFTEAAVTLEPLPLLKFLWEVCQPNLNLALAKLCANPFSNPDSQNGAKEIARWLIEEGADINQPSFTCWVGKIRHNLPPLLGSVPKPDYMLYPLTVIEEGEANDKKSNR